MCYVQLPVCSWGWESQQQLCTGSWQDRKKIWKCGIKALLEQPMGPQSATPGGKDWEKEELEQKKQKNKKLVGTREPLLWYGRTVFSFFFLHKEKSTFLSTQHHLYYFSGLLGFWKFRLLLLITCAMMQPRLWGFGVGDCSNLGLQSFNVNIKMHIPGFGAGELNWSPEIKNPIIFKTKLELLGPSPSRWLHSTPLPSPQCHLSLVFCLTSCSSYIVSGYFMLGAGMNIFMGTSKHTAAIWNKAETRRAVCYYLQGTSWPAQGWLSRTSQSSRTVTEWSCPILPDSHL